MRLPDSMLLTEHRLRKAVWMLRGVLVSAYLWLHGCRVGRGLKCKMFPIFRQIPSANITFGRNVTIGYRVTLDVLRGALLSLGDHVNLTQDLVISCGSNVTIGAYSGVGEFSSIRDGEHGIDVSRNIHEQPVLHTPIHIGRDVQVSRGCTVLGGAVLEDGSILGANCIAGRNFRGVKNGIYFGTPPKLIGKRVHSETNAATNSYEDVRSLDRAQ